MYIGIDIGGTKCAVIKAKENGEILEKVKFPTTSYNETINKIFEAVEKMGKAEAIGISCGGPLNSKTGVIIAPPNLPEWRNVPIAEMLKAKFGITAYLQNDANACALAEWQFGAGQNTDNMVFLTFGTGMGAGLILNGRLYEGTNGNAGEIGHIRMEKDGPIGFGKKGSFEGFCSGGGIKQIAQAYARTHLENGEIVSFCESIEEIESITAKTVGDCAEKGYIDAKEVYEISGEYLGKGLAVLVDILNPEKIVIGSIYERSENLLKDSMLKTLKAEALEESLAVCEIVPAVLGDKIGDYAAISVAKAQYK